MNFKSSQLDVFKRQEKNTADTIKKLNNLYEKAKKDLRNAVIAEQSRNTKDSIRRANSFQDLIDQIDKEIGDLQSQTSSLIKGGATKTYVDTYNRIAYDYDAYMNTAPPFRAAGETNYLNFTFLDADTVKTALFNNSVAGKTISPVQFSGIMAGQRTALREGIRNIIANVVATGFGVDAAAEALEPLFILLGDTVDKAKKRAATTARTEILRAYSLSQIEADEQAVESGVELRYIWETAKDERVRSSHRSMQGQKAQLNASGDPFFQYPDGTRTPAPRVYGSAANVINCRCTRISYPEGFEPTGRTYRDSSGTWKQNADNLEYQTWLKDWKKRV